MKTIFWKDGSYEATDGIYIRNELKNFFKKLSDKGLVPVGIEVDEESLNVQVFVEKNDAYEKMYENNSQLTENT